MAARGRKRIERIFTWSLYQAREKLRLAYTRSTI
jgi:hypothetical protein